MKNLPRLTCPRVLAACAVAVAGVAIAAPPIYRVTEISVPVGYSTPAVIDINDRDQLLLTMNDDSTRNREGRAFLWSPADGLVAGPQPKRTEFRQLAALDNQGRIVGSESCHTCASDGFHWRPGSPLRLLRGLYDGAAAHASDVNDAGTVVGGSYASDVDRVYHVVTWTAADGVRDRQPAGLYSSDASAINGAGQIVGGMARVIHDQTSAMLIDPDGSLTELGTLPGGDFSYARAINAGGAVVGAGNYALDFPNHAFVWTKAGGLRTMLAGSALAGFDSDAFSVNDAGQAVGMVSTHTAPYVFRNFVWSAADGAQVLADQVDPADPLAGRVAFDGFVRINNHGLVATTGVLDGVAHAFVLTPVAAR